MKVLEGKRAFVTGAGRGIGKAIATQMAKAGATVAIADIDRANAEAVAAEIHGAVPVELDISNRAAVFAAIDAFAGDGGLDILVNNAVYFYYALVVDTPEEEVDKMLNVGIKGTIWCTAAATPHLEKSGGGTIINMSSIALDIGIKIAGVYTAVKGAVDAFTLQQATELGPMRIRVNALAPGSVMTPGASSVIPPAMWERAKGRSLFGELVTDQEIADGAVFLASDAARSITGITLKIDGGRTIAGM